MSEEEDRFKGWVSAAVAGAVRQSPAGFAELTSMLPGTYPEEVLQALQSSIDKVWGPVDEYGRLVESAKVAAPPKAAPSGLLGLPPPHPLDFEWRFAPVAISELTEAIQALSTRGSAVALVGTPTLAATCSELSRTMNVDYFGLDGDLLSGLSLVSHLRSVRHTNILRASVGAERYDVVVMDPPWYEEYLQRFLFFASQRLVVGGSLLIAMPARGTRPGIPAEQARTIEWAGMLGLEVVQIKRGVLPYETPPFERNALYAAGVSNVTSDWRRGEMWTLRKQNNSMMPWPGDVIRSDWKELRIGAVRVRIDVNAQVLSEDTSLRSLVTGDVLSTVSRRDPRRSMARVWTAANRVFACDSPATYAAQIEGWLGQRVGSESNRNDGNAKERFFEIIDRERSDLQWPG